MILKETTNQNKTKFPQTDEPTNQQNPKSKQAPKSPTGIIKSNVTFGLGQELDSGGYNFLHNCQCLPLPHLLFY